MRKFPYLRCYTKLFDRSAYMNLLEWVGKLIFDHAEGKGTKSLTKTNTFDENLPSKILVQRDDVNMTGSKVLQVVRILIAHMTMTLKIVTTAGTKLSDHDCFYHQLMIVQTLLNDCAIMTEGFPNNE